MKVLRFALILLALFSAAASAGALPPNELPMYGGVQKTAAMKKADAEFIAAMKKAGYSRQSGAREAVDRGRACFDKGDYAGAMRRFNQAWLLDPGNGDVYHGFALVVLERDKAPAEAEKYFRMALAKPGVSMDARINYGRFLWLQGRFDDSLTQLKRVLEISPQAHDARAHISFVYYRKGDFPEACRWARAARANHDHLEPGYLEDMCSRAGMK